MDYGNGNYPAPPYFNTGVYPGYDLNNPPMYFPHHAALLSRDPFRSNSPFGQEQLHYPVEQDPTRWSLPQDYQNHQMRQYRQVVSLANPEQDELSVERSYTPTFQGSGPSLFPDETHDEMRRAVAFAMTAEQFDLDERLQLLLNQLSLLSGDMKECIQDLTVNSDKFNCTARSFPVKPSPNSVKAAVVGDDPRRVIVNTSNKLIKVPKLVNASEQCETEHPSNDILVVDSSKQSVRSLMDWVPLANGKKRKVNVLLHESSESLCPQSKKRVETDNKVGSSSVLDEQNSIQNEILWYEQHIVKPIPIKIEETENSSNCDNYRTIDLTNNQSDSVTVIVDDSSDTRTNSFDIEVEPISRLESCQASPSDNTGDRSAESNSSDFAGNENQYAIKGSYSLRIIKGHRIPGGSRECYANIEGKCTSGIFCRFDHTGQPKNCCSRLLRGRCRPDNKHCCAPHTLLPHQYPVCSFYLREDCSSWPNCKLLHAKHHFRTAYCGDFGRGCCFKGLDCEYVHSYQKHVIRNFENYGYASTVSYQDENRDAVTDDNDHGNTSVLNWIED